MAPRQEMKMNVEYRLAGAGVIIIDYPEPLFRYSPLSRNQCGHLKDMTDEGVVLKVEIQGVNEMLPGDEQNVRRCDRCNVLNGHDLLILINFLCGDFTLNDLAENTAVQTSPPLFNCIFWRSAGFKTTSDTVIKRESEDTRYCILH